MTFESIDVDTELLPTSGENSSLFTVSEAENRPNLSLRHQRERRAWTQRDLAEKIGTTPSNISRWENGITTPIPYFQQKLCETLGVSVEELGLFLPLAQEVAINRNNHYFL